MRNVLFVAPFSFETTAHFIEAAATHPDTRLVLISEDRLEAFPPALRKEVGGHWRVSNALEASEIAVAAEAVSRRLGPVHRLLGTLEQLQVPLAEVRERLGIPGMGVEVARGCRDKERLHRLLDDAGVPVVTAGEVAERGADFSWDAALVGGRVAWQSVAHYLSPPVELAERSWIQWTVLLPREADDPASGDVRELAARAFAALGLADGVCHLEGLRRPDGSPAVSAVGARPIGSPISKLISCAHEPSFYRLWAEVMIDGTCTPPRRDHAAGVAVVRGGPVRSVAGLEEARREVLPLVVESNLPGFGRVPSGSEEGYVLLRHHDTEAVREALRTLVSRVRMDAQPPPR